VGEKKHLRTSVERRGQLKIVCKDDRFLYVGRFLFTSFFQKLVLSSSCLPPEKMPVINANWQSHIPAVSMRVSRLAECFCDLFYWGTGAQNLQRSGNDHETQFLFQ